MAGMPDNNSVARLRLKAQAWPHLMREMRMDAELEKQLKEKIGESFEEAVDGKIEEFGGLVSRASALRLLCKENGIGIERKIRLAQARETALPFSFEAKIDRIFPLQAYEGRNSVSLRVHLSDRGGEGTLVLWNERAKEASAELSIGDNVECTGAYFRNGEISIGSTGTIKKMGGLPVRKVGSLSYGPCSVEGIVGKIEVNSGGEGAGGAAGSFELCEGEKCTSVRLMQRQEDAPKKGERLLLQNVFFKAGEIYFDRSSRMARKGHVDEKAGNVESAGLSGSAVNFSVGGKEFAVTLQEALVLLKIRGVPEGVKPETLIGIKLQKAIGRGAKYDAEKGIVSIDVD